MPTLTDNQRRIVEAPIDRCTLVNAGPGTGKTFVLVERVGWLLEQGISLDEILLVTFTRKAALELRERLGRRLLESGHVGSLLELEAAWVTNFHGFCGQLLREHALAAGYDPDSRVQDEVEAAELAFSLRRSFLESVHAQTALEAARTGDEVPAAVVERLAAKVPDAIDGLGAAREHLLDGPTALARAETRLEALGDEELTDEQAARLQEDRESHAVLGECLPSIERDYERAKEADSLLDFVDLQTRAIELLATEAGDRIRSHFRAVLVDEFQDTNRAQLELLRLLTDERFGGMMAVGDERQSIYAFRGARVGNIRELPGLVRDAGGACDELELFESFRSYQEVLDVSVRALRDGVDKAVPERQALQAVALREAAADELAELPPVQVIHAADREGEADAIADIIERRVGTPVRLADGTTRALRWGDFAVLLRSVGTAKVYENALIERDIPYRTFGGTGFFDRKEILDLLAYLQVIANPYDSLALVRVLQERPFGLSQRSLYELANAGRMVQGEELLETDAHEETAIPGFRLKPWDAIRAALDDRARAADLGLAPATLDRLARLRVLVERYLGRRETVPVSRLLLDVLAETGYGKLLQAGEPGEEPLQALRRRKNVERLLRLARRHEDRHTYGSLWELVRYLKRAFEMGLREEEESLEADDRVVNLMTVHQAKGKEWPVVFVGGLTDQSWPMSGFPKDLLFAEESGLFLRRQVQQENDAGAPRYDETLLAERVKNEHAAESDLEERRILFVAMTRAKHLLVCCGHGGGTLFLDRVAAALVDGEVREAPPAREVPTPASTVDGADLAESLDGALARLAQSSIPTAASPNFSPQGVHLSFSQVALFNSCPRRYQFTHVLPLPGIHQQPTSKRGEEGCTADLSPAELGTIFHEALERWASDEGHPILALAEEAARDRGWLRLSDADAERACRFAEHFEASSLSTRRPRSDELEVPFSLLLELPDGRVASVSGSIDRIDPGPDGWIVTDYKTNRAVEPEKYVLQLSIYRLAMESVLGKPVARSQAYFVRYPEGVGLCEVPVLSHEETRARVLQVAERIAFRDFELAEHPGPNTCWRCPYGGKEGLCPDRLLHTQSTEPSSSKMEG